MYNLSLKELSSKLQAREITSAELVEVFIARIDEKNADVQCFTTPTYEQARELAAKADADLSAGRGGLLRGIPVAYQDSIVTQGIKTSAGSKMLENFVAPYDAELVVKAKDAGLPTLGKTAMAEFSIGRGAGFGSTAKAVAEGLAPVAVMLDSGQALVQEALAAGVLGFRPSYGAISRYGLVAKASSMDQASIVAKSAEDVAYLLGSLIGKDAKDNTSEDLSEVDFIAALAQEKSWQVGVVKQLNSSVAQDLGLNSAVEVDLPLLEVAAEVFEIISAGETSSNLSRYDGVRFGYRCENPQDLEDMYFRSRSEGLGEDVKEVILAGTWALSEGSYKDFYQQAQKIRRLIIAELDKAFATCDFIAMPASSDEQVLGAMLAALVGLPCVSLPSGAVLLGRRFADADLLSFAHQVQSAS